jgi:hypothetical protein
MTINVIDAAATKKGSSATPGGGGERALMVLVATREARDLRTRAAQEEAVIEAEGILRQAEEALVMG